jgi:hypothetical protein
LRQLAAGQRAAPPDAEVATVRQRRQIARSSSVAGLTPLAGMYLE